MQQISKLRTLDVWDTLIRRHCHPECIKLAVAQHVHLRFSDKLCQRGTDVWALYLERLEVERTLAAEAREKGHDDEYSLEEVVNRWVDRILQVSAGERDSLANELVELEFTFECERSFPDPDIATFLTAHPAEKTIFLSDFYMEGALLQRLLRYHGLDTLVDDGVSSCDVGLNKRSGKLFAHVHSCFGVSASDHIHVGDNAHSDVAMPKQLGVRSVHFLPDESHRQRQLREQLFSTRSELFRHVQEKALSEAKTHLETGAVFSDAAFLTGLRAAPLFIGFSQFIAECSLKDKVERVFFQTREGEFFLRIFKTLFPDNRFAGMALPAASLLEVSRLATFTASLQDTSVEQLLRLWRLVQNQSMGALLKTLGMPEDEFKSVLQRHGLSLEEVIDRPWEHAGVNALLQDHDFKQALNEKIQSDRCLLMRYLEQAGLAMVKRVATVDIGWRGTIQDNLALVAPSVFFSGYYLGLQRFLNPQPENVTKAAFGPDANRESQWIALLDAVSPIEMLCNSRTGSVEGYVHTQNGVTARRRIDEAENRAFERFAKEFQDGVIFATEVWRPYLQSYAVASVELRDVAMKIWNSLSENSPEEMVQACLSAPQNDIFGFGDFFNRQDLPSVGQIFRGIYSRADRQLVIQYIKRTQWPSAIRHRKDIGSIHRYLLIGIVNVARSYKHLRLKYRHLRSAFSSNL